MSEKRKNNNLKIYDFLNKKSKNNNVNDANCTSKYFNYFS